MGRNSQADFKIILQSIDFCLLEKVYNPCAVHRGYRGFADNHQRFMILKTKQFLCKTIATTSQ